MSKNPESLSKHEDNLVVGFSKEDARKVRIHLERLLPYLVPDEFVFVGGIAIRYHLNKAGISYPPRPFNDLDIIVKSSETLLPSVKTDFLIYHYHPNKNGWFFVALVDPVSKTKVDIFPYDPAPEETIQVNFGGYQVRLVSSEDQLIKTALDIRRVSPKIKVDPKQFSDADYLLKIVDLNKAEKIWRRKFYALYGTTLSETIQTAKNIALLHPEWIKEKPFRKPNPYVCKDCESTPDFPLTPMEEVYKVLGYIE